MLVYYCDCCTEETGELYPISYLCHIDQIIDGDTSIYVDREFNAVSGKFIYKYVCIRCYNNIMTSCVKKFRELKNGFREVNG